MSRPVMIIALLLAVVGGIFMLASVGGNWGLYLLGIAVILTIVGVLTGK